MNPNENPSQGGGRNWLMLIGIPLLLLVGLWVVLGSGPRKQETKYSEIVGYFEQNKVEAFSLDLNDGSLEILLRENVRTDTNKDGKVDEKDKITYTVPNLSIFVDSVVTDIVDAHNRDDDPNNDVKVYDIQPQQQTSWLVSMLPTLIITSTSPVRTSCSRISRSLLALSVAELAITKPARPWSLR